MGRLARELKASFQQEKKLQAKGEAGLGAMGQENLLERTKGRGCDLSGEKGGDLVQR